MLIHSIFYLFFAANLHLLYATSPLLTNQADNLIQKSESFHSPFPGDGFFPEINLQVQNCDSYPHYGYSRNGADKIAEDFNFLLQQTKQCLSHKGNGQPLPDFVESTFSNFYQVLLSERQKTMACTYGVYNSFYAVSNAGIEPDNEGPNGVFNDMPPPPSLLMDTNRMSGNFPVQMSERNIENFHRFYGLRLNGVEVTPGQRNPLISRVNNSASLLFHELFHWTGLKHFPKDYPDLVYLSQICCFEHENLDSDVQKKACNMMWDENNWDSNSERRMQHLRNNSIFDEVKDMINKYHDSEKHREFTPHIS